jgi:hypothetical protein
MVRQCAWCLCLIDSAGERLSPSPLPKLYEATHGICGVCGMQWMEQVLGADETQKSMHKNNGNVGVSPETKEWEQQGTRETITQFILQLQQPTSYIPPTPTPHTKKTRKTRIF